MYVEHFCNENELSTYKAWVGPGGVVYVVVSSLPATEETGAMGREIKSRQGIGW
jgi:hypothetical protein